MKARGSAGYPNWVFWVILAVVALAGLGSRGVDEKLVLAWPRLVWAAVSVAQKILLDW